MTTFCNYIPQNLWLSYIQYLTRHNYSNLTILCLILISATHFFESVKLCASRAHVPCVLMYQRVLHAYVSRANMSSVLMCQCVLHPYVPTCLVCAYMPCVLTCQHTLCAYVPTCLAYLHAHMPYMPKCSHAITSNNKNKFSMTSFTQISGTFSLSFS